MMEARVLLIAALAAAPVAAVAAPCIDDRWQPTFVHDLENEDGPYYVNAGGGFTKLRWQADGGYVPHACELVKGPQDVRDVVGFTTCNEYTRIQCGCSRAMPGNRTCAAFLQWHPASPAGPIGVAPTAASTPGSIAVAPTPTLTPGPTTVAPTPALTPITVALAPTNWQQAPQYRGAVMADTAGLVLRGGPWTNGRLSNNFLDGNRIYSSSVYDFSSGGDAYMRFLADGGGKYMVIWPRVVEGVSVPLLSTDHSWANSVVIAPNVWVFAHLKVSPEGSWKHVVSLGGYDDSGGQAIAQATGRFVYPRGRLDLQFGDNYAGESASVTIGEAKVVAAGSAVVTSPPPPPTPVNPTAGGTCSKDVDCPGSICLLGVCASGTGKPIK
jgi:hypothetical protein